MKSKKVEIILGYTKNGNLSEGYRHFNRTNLYGADITIIDGIGNKIEVGARQHGTLISLNNKVLKDIEKKEN